MSLTKERTNNGERGPSAAVKRAGQDATSNLGRVKQLMAGEMWPEEGSLHNCPVFWGWPTCITGLR